MKKQDSKRKIPNTKSSKGITLIALIITIIVLLILAVVAIRAVTGDGIIQHAINARDSYQQAQEDEEALLQGYLEKIKENNNQDEEMSEEDMAEFDLLERYVLGPEKTGRLVTEIANVDMTTMTITSFINEESTISDASTSITYLCMGDNEDNTKGFVYSKYNNKVYKAVIDMTTFISEKLELIYVPQGNEGKTVIYESDGDTTTTEYWTVITDRKGILEIVSADVMYDKDGKTLNESYGPLNTFLTAAVDLDGDGTIGNNGDLSILAYNNIIKIINDFCEDIVVSEDNEGVRSLGASTDILSEYSSETFNSWFKGTATIKAGDISYEEDLVKLHYWNIYYNVSDEFYFASRNIEDYETGADGANSILFGTVAGDPFYDNGKMHACFVYELFEEESFREIDDSRQDIRIFGLDAGVRPVVINPSNIQYVD